MWSRCHFHVCAIHRSKKCDSCWSIWASSAAFWLCALLVGRGRIRSHPSPANSHQSGPMLEPWREEAIAHSTGAHSPSTQGGQGHLTHQGPVYFSLLSGATLCTSTAAYVCGYACTLISAMLHFFLVSWWFLCTTPACKCLNHRPGVRPHIQQRSAFLISFHLTPQLPLILGI